jgi:hypothetical protein
MQLMIKRFLSVLLLASALQTSWAFSPGGPIGNGGDSWQQPVIGYGLPGDLNAPKNIGEEYRRNTPLMYYTFDANFLEFFGPQGATSVDNAYAILNSLTNVDAYSKQLSEFSLETRNINYQAQALGLMDIKSQTLGLMMEQLGLADPIRYAWTLHDRLHVGNVACPAGMEYLVVQRNFDYVSSPLNQLQYSPYVNDTLYSYQILEACSGPNPLALAVPFSVDPLADTYSPVSTLISGNIFWGDYYTGLTRDDVAGLRYLLSTNNINWETPAADALVITTNTSFEVPFPLTLTATNGGSGFLINGVSYGTASYYDLLTFSKTNNLATLLAAYPGLQATLVSNFLTTVYVTNTISYFTNYYGEAIGTPPHLITKKVRSQAVVEYFYYTFDNIITNIYTATTTSKLQTITVAPLVGAPIGSPLATNVSNKTVKSQVPSGEFYILPADSPCGLDIISTLVTFTNYTTNIITTSSSTNSSAGTTNSGQSYTQLLITPSISHVYKIHPVTCSTSNAVTGLYRGIGNIKFARADYDSLIGQFWQPVTNDYSMVLVAGSKSTPQHFRRVVTQPDFLFTAQDLDTSPSDNIIGSSLGARSLSFDQANILPGLAGPGTIETPQVITYNKAGQTYFNSSEDVMDGTPYFTQTPGGDISDLYYITYFVWASFDGTTNAPVVYPNGTSIDDLQNQILIRVSPASPLPSGLVDFDYYVQNAIQFTATGGAFSQPFTWSGSDLPNGMSVEPDGKLVGTPTQAGTFDFGLKLTDSLGRTVQWTYTITITTTPQ